VGEEKKVKKKKVSVRSKLMCILDE
jgi:hypothetical protein